MQSNAPDVNAYMDEVPEERRAALQRLRQLCLEVLEGYDETMAYGMPCYTRSGEGGVAFANQRHYISLYVEKDVLDEQRAKLAAARIQAGKGCARFTRPNDIPYEVVREMLVATVAFDNAARTLT